MPTMTRAGYTPPKAQPPRKKPDPAPKTGKKKKKKKKRVNGVAAASLMIFLIAALLGAGTVYIYLQTQPYQQAFLPGTMLMGYPLAGATQAEAQALLDTIEQEYIAPWQAEIACGDTEYLLTAEDVGLAIDREATIAPLWAAGREGGILSCYLAMMELAREPLVMQPVLHYDLAAVDALLQEIRADAESAPVDATVRFVPGSAEPFAFTQEQTGYALDTSGVREAIERDVRTMNPSSIALEAKELAPKTTRAQLEASIVLRSRVRMEIADDAASLANVRLAAQKLNGLHLEPGEALSFNEAVGARTKEAGYLPAAEPAYGADAAGVGGGVCQLSTALYRAALMADIGVRERHAAARPVPYCDMGQEAAVSDQGLDLVIENPTAHPLFLTARVYEDEGAFLEVMLIGAPLEVRYQLATLAEETGLITEPVYIRDREGKYATYSDERVPVGEALMGYSASVERYAVLEGGAQTQGEIVSESMYEAVPPTIYVGMKDREE